MSTHFYSNRSAGRQVNISRQSHHITHHQHNTGTFYSQTEIMHFSHWSSSVCHLLQFKFPVPIVVKEWSTLIKIITRGHCGDTMA